MKTRFLRILFVGFTLFIAAQPPLRAAEIESQELSLGQEAASVFSQDDEAEGYMATLPSLTHALEINLFGPVVLTLDTLAEFTLEKVTADEETANAVNVECEPALEWGIQDALSAIVGMPLNFANTKSGESNTDRENMFDLAAKAELDYSTMEEDFEGISAWRQFKDGLTLTGIFWQQLYGKEGDEKAEDLDTAIGLEAEYAYFDDIRTWMFNPSLVVMKHLNSNADESLEIEGKADLVKDLNRFLTLGAELGLNAVKEDADTDMESELFAGGRVIFSGIENLDISPGFEYTRSISDSDADPAYAVKLVMKYTIF
jgi:hypothetical protein